MSELLTFLLTQEQQFRRYRYRMIAPQIIDADVALNRARIPSLYSDFRLQRTANPDGYSANIAAWETGLTHALQEGLIPGGKDVLSLKTGDALLQALDTREWGKPLALAAVVVGEESLQVKGFDVLLLTMHHLGGSSLERPLDSLGELPKFVH